MLQASFGTGHPKTRIPGRIVANMLLVTTLKFRNPVRVFVQVIAYDFTRRSCGVTLQGVHMADFLRIRPSGSSSQTLISTADKHASVSCQPPSPRHQLLTFSNFMPDPLCKLK